MCPVSIGSCRGLDWLGRCAIQSIHSNYTKGYGSVCDYVPVRIRKLEIDWFRMHTIIITHSNPSSYCQLVDVCLCVYVCVC